MRQSLAALSFLAAPGVPDGYVHHDLKTENMVVRESKGSLGVQLIDFGGMLKADVFSSSASSVSNPNAAVEWKDSAFDAKFPFAFDIFSMAHVFMELLTGETLLDMQYRAANYASTTRKNWCTTNKVYSSCRFWHRIHMFWEYVEGFNKKPIDHNTIIGLVNKRGSPRHADLQSTFFDVLKEDQSFLNFLDFIGKMLHRKASFRPSADEILRAAFLQPAATTTTRKPPQVNEQKPIKREKVIKNKAPAKVVPETASEAKVKERQKRDAERLAVLLKDDKVLFEKHERPAEVSKFEATGNTYSKVGPGLCINWKNEYMSHLWTEDEGSSCQAWCSVDNNCFGFAVSTPQNARTHESICRIYTTAPHMYKTVGYGRRQRLQSRGIGAEWNAVGIGDEWNVGLIKTAKNRQNNGLKGGDWPTECYKKKVESMLQGGKDAVKLLHDQYKMDGHLAFQEARQDQLVKKK